MNKGFTLVEILVTIAIVSCLGVVVFGIYALIISEIRVYREKTIVASLADQYIEIARNLPYADIGTVNGTTCDKPEGQVCLLPDLANPDSVDLEGATYNVYYAISYVDDPADGTALLGTDAAPNDYKQVKLYVANTATNITESFSTTVSPKGFENLGNRGVLSIEVFDATGQPVQGAAIHIVNNNVSPAVDVTRTSGSNGSWLEVGVPPDINGYNITVSKNGYSSDQTHPISVENPNPAKPDSTVIAGQVTQVSFSIDYLTSLTFYTLDQACQAMPAIDFEVRGSKLIGTSPSVYKFDETYTSDGTGGIYPASDPCWNGKCLEWDSYSVSAVSGNYMVYGTSPIQQTSVLPGSSQEFSLLIGPKSAHSMLVIVKESGTGDPIEGASVTLDGPVLAGPLLTGGSVWGQQDWSGASESSNVSTAEIPYALRLAKVGGNYVDSGWLISSTFDTGTGETSYTTLNWQPISQDPSASIQFQVATNNDNETWDFIGPDGTSGTYYTVSGNTISTANNNARYARYKVFLSTSDSAFTPVISNISLNYISGCYTPGQVMLADLIENTEGGYTVTVSKDGYQTQIVGGLNVDGYELLEVQLSS